MSPFKYIGDIKPPTCLHILGQSLVNALHQEGRQAAVERAGVISYAMIALDERIKNNTLSPQDKDLLNYIKSIQP